VKRAAHGGVPLPQHQHSAECDHGGCAPAAHQLLVGIQAATNRYAGFFGQVAIVLRFEPVSSISVTYVIMNLFPKSLSAESDDAAVLLGHFILRVSAGLQWLAAGFYVHGSNSYSHRTMRFLTPSFFAMSACGQNVISKMAVILQDHSCQRQRQADPFQRKSFLRLLKQIAFERDGGKSIRTPHIQCEHRACGT